MSPHLAHAWLLFHQGRPDLAEPELRRALADDPDHAEAHALLALCLARFKKLDAATDEAERAVACAADLPLAHYALATARYHRNHYPEAEAAIREAIRLDPTDAGFHAMLGGIRMDRSDWLGALAAADAGLEHDPKHAVCTNVRAMALVKLGRRAEAGAAIAGALGRDPDHAFTHANRGWSFLHEGEPRKALEHFREALRLDPELGFARAGMIEALKARYWLYRQVLRYFLWMSRLSPQARWGVVLGLLAIQQVGARLVDDYPLLAPFLIAYAIFALTTWTAVPLANLFLRLNRFGRYALSRDQRVASNWVGGFLLVALGGVGYGVAMWGIGDHAAPGWITAITAALLLIPVSATFSCPVGWPRRGMAVYTAAMVGIGLLSVGLLVAGLDVFPSDKALGVERFLLGLDLFRANCWAGLLSGFVANLLVAYRPRL
jgi:tetratricopeptide (TPR) repeat protein